jgi:cytochrome P460
MKFPEYHHVYIEKKNVDACLKTGSFPEGTMIVKELTRVLDPTFPDGSRKEPSGRGYFNGQYNGTTLRSKTVSGSPKPMAGAFLLLGIIRCHMRRQLRNPLQQNAPSVTRRMFPTPI